MIARARRRGDGGYKSTKTNMRFIVSVDHDGVVLGTIMRDHVGLLSRNSLFVSECAQMQKGSEDYRRNAPGKLWFAESRLSEVAMRKLPAAGALCRKKASRVGFREVLLAG
jgi:hypothetical protein